MGKPNLPVSFEYPINLPEVRMFTRNRKNWNISVEKEAIWSKEGEARIFYLEEEEFDIVHGEDGATVVHVLLQVSFQILKHQRQALVRVHDVVKGDWKKKSDNPRCHRYPRETKGRPDWPLFDPRPIFTIRSPASLADAAFPMQNQ